jgi:hypothetical protein
MRAWMGIGGVVAGMMLLLGGCGTPGNGENGNGENGNGANGNGANGNGENGNGANGNGENGNGENGNGDPVGGAAYRGEILFIETFEDTDFTDRGWYDVGADVVLTTDEPPPGATHAFVCHYPQGATACAGGIPKRRQFAETDAVYLSYWVRYSENWIGSDRAYHPHELHFTTNADDRWVGPARTHLTAYVENVGGVPRIALQDSRNVDAACILRNNDTFEGCDGSFDDYVFTEARSVCACNGLFGEVDGRDCFSTGGGNWYSARFWRAPIQAFADGPGPYDKSQWRFVEAFLAMNGIADGIGQVDGAIRLWVDGELLVSSDEILMRTGALPDLAFEQFILAPYIGDGSPVAQTMWLGPVTVARGVRP